MTSTPLNKKKLSDYKLEDLKDLFSVLTKKISSKIILIELTNNSFIIAIAKLNKNKLIIKNIYKQDLPSEALEKSIPTDPIAFGRTLSSLLKELKLNGLRVAVSIPSDASYTRLIDIPDSINEELSKDYVDNPDSGVQIPISLNNTDYDVALTSLPKRIEKNKSFNRYFLTSMPKRNLNTIIEAINEANLELCAVQMSHMCIGNLLKTEISKLDNSDIILSIELLDEFTQLIFFDNSGPIFIKRLGSIKRYPSIQEMKSINENKQDKNKKIKSYLPLSNLDLKVLIREIQQSLKSFMSQYDCNSVSELFVTGRNSQHKNLVAILGEKLNMNISLISPINHFKIDEINYDTDELNYFSFSRILGLGISLIKDDYYFSNETQNKSFFIERFVKDENIEVKEKSNNEVSKLKNKIKEKEEKEEKKEEVKEKRNDLPPLPNLKIKKEEKIDGEVSQNKNLKENTENKETKKVKIQEDFKMDTSFLDID